MCPSESVFVVCRLNRIVAEAEQDDVEERVFWKGDHPEK